MKFFQNSFSFKKIYKLLWKEEKRNKNNIIINFSLLINILLLIVNIPLGEKIDLNFF